MTSGARDTLIIFMRREKVRNAVYGTNSGSWVEHSQAWAEVMDVLPSRAESLDENLAIQRRPARVRIDYVDGIDITSDMQIDIDGRKLRIVSGPAMKGRRKEWEMMAEELSTGGQEP
ncbi:head-tail adaptor protein [Sphingobium sp. TB-6]|uniref:phage head completion protein n=1 Tax=Sphingobium sp. TB-6 TaxID=2728850 RepID=UPI00146B47A8|nr:head-tail adaptor protein [Sphingobium sp. TB-6]NML88754.1 head-tail adaptor protein [Sphingobium sp. TB-6]